MSVCEDCNKEMLDVDTCDMTKVIVDGEELDRNTEYFDVNERCHDCNILNKPGNLHHLGCDMERCPKCKGQLISCNCDKSEW